jgi:hypothetical protein
MRQNIEGSHISNSVLGAGNKVETLFQTLGAAITLDADAPNYLALDPGGAGRDVTLPAEAEGLFFMIANAADAAENLTVKNDAAGTVGTIGQNEVGFVVCINLTWYIFVGVA